MHIEGVNSIARKYLAADNGSNNVKVTPWKCAFRVLLTPPETSNIPGLDVETHYIFGGA